jgi:hypothetical protein
MSYIGVEHYVHFDQVAVTAAQDLFELIPTSAKPLVVEDGELSQSTELGDAQEEQLVLRWRRGNTTTGSGGTSPTPVKKNPSFAAASFTAKANNTTKATAGTVDTLMPSTWQIRAEKRFMVLPQGVVECPAGSRLCLELVNAPADSVTISGWLLVREVG